MSTLAGRVATSVRWSMLDQVVQQVVRFGLTLLLTRLTSPEAYGLIGIAFVFTGIASFVGDLGMGAAVVQRKDLTPRHVDTAAITAFGLGVVLAALVVVTAPWSARAFDEPDLALVLAVVALNFPVKAVGGVLRDVLRRDLEFGGITVANVVGVLVSGAAAAVVAVSGGGVWALVVYSVGEACVVTAAMLVACLRAGVHVPRPRFSRTAFRDLFSFGLSVTGFKLLYYLQINLDNLLVGKFLGATALGFYGLAYRLMLYPIQRVGDVIANVALPAFSVVQDSAERLTGAYRRGTVAISLVVFPLSVGTVVAAPVLVPLAVGEQWTPAVLPLQVLALNGPRLAVNRLGSAVFQATGRPHWDVWLAGGGLVVYVGAFAVGLQHGVVGMAWAYTAAGFALLVPNQVLITRTPLLHPTRVLWSLWPVVLGCVALVLAALGARELVPGHGFLAAVTVVLAGGAAYAAVVWLTGRGLVLQTVRDLRSRG